MKRKLKIYLDTSVINFLYYKQSPDYQHATIELFNNFILPNKYEAYFSSFVIDEINATKDIKKRNQLLNTFIEYPLNNLTISKIDEIQAIAEYYILKKIIPEKKFMDALHIAVSVVKDIDYLVSWNFHHLANVNKERLVKAANLEMRHKNELRIITPLELIDYGT